VSERVLAVEDAPARLSPEQWGALHWLESPTAYASTSLDGGGIYRTMPGLVTSKVIDGSLVHWRSTVRGRASLMWHRIYAALDHAASHGEGFVPPKIAKRLLRLGLVRDLGGEHPSIERVVRLTSAGRQFVQATSACLRST
jgi:hypothetical protein